MYDGEGKPGSHGRIDGIPARLQNLNPGLRRQFLHAHHHRMLCVHRACCREGGRRQSQDRQ
jgi:hypothetical protein